MISPVNQINRKEYFYLKPAIRKENIVCQQDFVELSGYKFVRNVLSGNNISFKGFCLPIETTAGYNKSGFNIEHLNIPNIKVYEYPDTNLQVIVNIADKVDFPLAEMELYNVAKSDYNPVHAELVNIIMNEKLNKIDNEAFYIQTGDYAEYGSYDGTVSIEKLNKIVFNTDFSQKELKNAKIKLINRVFSSEYKRKNEDLNYLYSKELIKSDDELYNDINNTTVNDLTKYYNSYLKNSSATLYVSLSKSDFDKNRNTYFSNFNKNIDIKLQKNECYNKSQNFIPNNKLQIIKSRYGFMPLEFHFPASINSEKENVIFNLVLLILLGNNYTILDRMYDDSINIKNPKDKIDNHYYNIGINKDIRKGIDINKELQELYNHINNVYESDISKKLNTLKDMAKQDAMYHLTQNHDSRERLHYIKSVNKDFNVYELIDSITEKDIKDYIDKYILNQKPIIHINKQSEFNA